MGKPAQKKSKAIINGKYYPLVSVCTPTFNRRPFIPIMFECFRNQTYPKSRIEWIIVDDGTDKIKDLVDLADIPQIKYFPVDKKMSLGQKRNYMHTLTTGNIIVYMDDDDYYPPERIEHAVETLQENKDALCAGSSEIYIYFKHIQKMYQAGPYSPTHATAGTFAFKRELLNQTRYEDHAAIAEEKHFLKNYTIPFAQLDPFKTILVFSHIHNTFDKRRLLENQSNDFFKESDKTINMFIRKPEEAAIKQFFMTDIEKLLNKYKSGDPSMKPDVLEQIVKIEKERALMQQQEMANAPKFMLNDKNNKQVELSPQEVVNMIQQLQKEMELLKKETELLKKQLDDKDLIIKQLQMELIQSKKNITPVPASPAAPFPPPLEDSIITTIKPRVIKEPSKCEPIMKFNVSD